ncbi:acetyl/propionyl/methylcrotonyl-CoA carboxylase subunit alpha [Alloalcanivorax sp. C16-1]|uniref:acetyl/propionyl/methylcrotonyl-CoA carboxylase subunit alpha n=1 Tax=Alloalcanivorax sp. C16-1 TaxID=3390051 RepID=UPI0039711140
MPAIDTLLIANRGEIARRIIRTGRQLGLTTVAVYSDIDADAAHVREADQAVRLGPASARDSYLNIEAVLAAARESGADAIHPGYGFLSENAAFAEACAGAGLIFVGPSPDSIRLMGDKAAARQRMAESGVPVLPGFDREGADDATLKAEADRVGFPLLIKAVAGGGGKGMRAVQSADGFDEALAAARREARNAFDDDRVLLERYLPTARHVEVQVFADGHGNAVHLFERDCSVQRRHQKIIEEAPAPGLSEQQRHDLGQAAVRAARAIDYRGAGTVEFLFSPEGEFFFMEMNTRLQVEHPVTELITGEDLVAWQLAVAGGRPLPKTQDDLRIRGAAMEVRLYAENPYQQFLPSSGPVTQLRWPDGVRVDAGVEQGDNVSDYYDPMLAKLIAHGDDRDQARRRLVRALDRLALAGPHHNAAFLRRVLCDPAFADAELDTRLLERHPHLLEAPSLDPALLAVAGAALVTTAAADGNDPWTALNAWRPLGRRRTLVPLRVDEHALTVVLDDDRASVADRSAPWTLHRHDDRFDLHWGEHRLSGLALFSFDDRRLTVFVHGQNYRIETHPARESERAGGAGDFCAPMSGTIVTCHVAAGDPVDAGAAVITLEAMKMEHTLRASAPGTVRAFLVKAGDSVSEGTLLVDFETEEE